MKLHIFIILVFSCSVFGQQSQPPCNLSLKEAPALRKLKLGMSPAKVSKVLKFHIEPISTETPIHLSGNSNKSFKLSDMKNPIERIDVGEKTFSLTEQSLNIVPERRPSKMIPALGGVRRIQLRFYKNQLFQIYIEYKYDGFNWENVQEFVSIVSEKLNLKKDFWETTNTLSILVCKDFSIIASVFSYSYPFSNSSLSLTDSRMFEELTNKAETMYIEQERLRTKTVEEKKRAFEP